MWSSSTDRGERQHPVGGRSTVTYQQISYVNLIDPRAGGPSVLLQLLEDTAVYHAFEKGDLLNRLPFRIRFALHFAEQKADKRLMATYNLSVKILWPIICEIHLPTI